MAVVMRVWQCETCRSESNNESVQFQEQKECLMQITCGSIRISNHKVHVVTYRSNQVQAQKEEKKHYEVVGKAAQLKCSTPGSLKATLHVPFAPKVPACLTPFSYLCISNVSFNIIFSSSATISKI